MTFPYQIHFSHLFFQMTKVVKSRWRKLLKKHAKTLEPVRSAHLFIHLISPTLQVSSECLSAEQGSNPTLKCCFERVVSAVKESGEPVANLLNKEILVKWTRPASGSGYNHVYQVVVLTLFHQHVL